jgi:hypothetical protein
MKVAHIPLLIRNALMLRVSEGAGHDELRMTPPSRAHPIPDGILVPQQNHFIRAPI